MVFPDAKYIETDLVSQRDRFEQIAEMFRGVDGPVRDSVNGCCDETVYANFHGFLILAFNTTARALLIAGSELQRAAARAQRTRSGRSETRRSKAPSRR